jgi:signal transduction histidine kinase
MRARLKEIGGTCTIDSAPGAGTKVTFSLPLLKPNRP